jgi:hypothetical protein
MSEENKRGYKAGTKAGNNWNVGQDEPIPSEDSSVDYKSGFKQGFEEKKVYKTKLLDLPIGPISPEVNFGEMKRDFDVYNASNLDETPLDLSLYDDEEPDSKRRKGGGGISKKRRKSKKSKKAKRSRKQKK